MVEILAKDKDVILYRKELNIITGSVTATLLLQQLIFRFVNNKNKPFYKFKEPCNHEKYNKGDSWCEELGFTRKEFDSAFKKLEDIGIATKNTNMDRVTFYSINIELLETKLSGIYLKTKRDFTKDQKGLYQKHQTDSMESTKGDLVYIDTETTTENTTDIKKINKKNSTLVDELEKEIELTENAKAILNDFLDYRKNIKKPIRTIQPLKAFLNEIRTIYKSGFDVAEAIEIMKSNEWQTIKLEYIQNTKKSNQVAIPKAENKTFYEQTEEAKQKKQQETLSNIAKVRELREQGLL